MRCLVLILALCALALPAAAQSRQDRDDRGFIQGLLEDALSGTGRDVRIEGFAGALSSRATIDRLTISDADGVWLTLEDVAMQWRRAALLRGQVEIDEITVARLSLPRAPLPADAPPTPEARGAFQLPELPVSVRLGDLTVDRADLGASLLGMPVALRLAGNARLADGAGQTELRIDRLDMAGSFVLDAGYDNATRRLDIDLSLDEPQGGLAATALNLPGTPPVTLRLQGDAPIDDFTADLRLATDGQDRLTGRFTLTAPQGPDVTRRFAATVAGDIAPLIAPDYRDFFGDRIALDVAGAQAGDGALRLDRLDLQTQRLSLTGTGALAPDGWPARLNLTGRIAQPDGNRVLLPLSGPRTYLDRAELALSFDAATGPDWQLTTRIDGLDRPDLAAQRVTLTGLGRIDRRTEAVSGTLAVVGGGLRLADPDLARAVGDSLRGALSFDWVADAPLMLDNIAFTGADYGVAGRVDITMPGEGTPLRLDPELSVSAADLSRFAPVAGLAGLGGAARLTVSGTLAPLNGLADLTLEGDTQDLRTGIAQVDPVLRGAGRLQLGLRRDETGTRADPLQIETDAARIAGTATLATGASRARLDATLRDTGLVLPGLRGPTRLRADAVQGDAGWQVTGRADAPGDATVNFDGTLNADSTRAQGRVTGRVGRLAAYAPVARRPIGGSADLIARGSANLQTGQLDITADLTGSDLRAGIPAADTLLQGRAQLALAARRDRDGTLRIDRLTLDAPRLNARVSGTAGPGGEALNLRANLPDLGVLVPDLPGAASLSGTARRSGTRWQLDLIGTGPGDIALNANGALTPATQRADLSITGRAPLALVNRRLAPNALDGTAQFDLRLNGPLGLQSLSGRVTTAEAGVSLPRLNLALRGLQAEVRLAAGRATLDAGARLSTGGGLRATGTVGLTQPFPAEIGITLDALRLRERDLYETTANGRVTLTGPLAGGARLGGRVELGTVELRIPQIGPRFALLKGLEHQNPSPDVRLTLQRAGLAPSDMANDATDRPAGGLPIDLLVAAPSRIFVRGRGLDAELGGELRLTGTTGDLVPQGSFTLRRGRLDLLNQRLDLTEGLVQLQGDFDPYVRFVAQTQTDDVTIEIRLEGLVSAPDLIISSVPELPQDEVLAQLLFGREVASLSPLQALRLADAVRTLSGRGTGVAEGLRQGLGVDDFDIGVTDDGLVEARVGQYLTENIYSDVAVNAEGNTEINLNLEITDEITLRGRAGSDGDTGVGIFFERDY